MSPQRQIRDPETGEAFMLQVTADRQLEVWDAAATTLETAIVASDPQLFQALPVQVTTSTSFASVLSGSCSALRAGVYRVSISYGWSHDTSTADFSCQFLWGGAALTTHGGGLLQRQEPKDSAGTNQSGTGTDQAHVTSMVYYVSAVAGDTPSFDVLTRSGTGGQEASIWDLSVAVERFSA